MKNRLDNYYITDTLSPVRNNTYIVQADNTLQLAETQAFNSTLKAALAKTALDNTRILALAEERYIREAPTGAADYRYIIESYVNWCVAEINRGDW